MRLAFSCFRQNMLLLALCAATLSVPFGTELPTLHGRTRVLPRTQSLLSLRGGELQVADAVKAGAGAAVGFGTLSVITKTLLPHVPGNVTVLCPPLGALAVLLFCFPDAPASQPRALVLGHLVGACAALASNLLMAGHIMAPGVAVALAITGMKLFACVHPPAAAYAFLVALQGGTNPKRLLFPGLLGAVLLMATQKAYFAIIDIAPSAASAIASAFATASVTATGWEVTTDTATSAAAPIPDGAAPDTGGSTNTVPSSADVNQAAVPAAAVDGTTT